MLQGLVDAFGRSATCKKVDDERWMVLWLRRFNAPMASLNKARVRVLCSLGRPRHEAADSHRVFGLGGSGGAAGWAVMWVAHLFSDKDWIRCHRSPEFCNGSDLQPTRTYCRTALHARSQGAVIGQGSVAESWLAVTQGACTNGQTCAVTFAENNRLFDGEARCCCKSVDNHTSVVRARVAPTMRAACAAERAGIRTGKVTACFAHTFASQAPTWAFAVLHLDFPALSVDPPSAVVGL